MPFPRQSLLSLREDRAPGNLLLIVQYPVFSALRPPHRNLIDLLLLRLLRQLARTNLVLDRPMRRTRRSLARIQILFHTSPLPDRSLYRLHWLLTSRSPLADRPRDHDHPRIRYPP